MKFLSQATDLTGNRTPKTDELLIQTTPTEGTVRVNFNAAAMMGIDYDTIIASTKADRGVRMNIVLFGELIIATVCADDKGAKLASSNGKRGSNLQFNSQPMWDAMKGSDSHNQLYTVSATDTIVSIIEGKVISLETAKEMGLINDQGTWSEDGSEVEVGYIMTFVREEAKPVRVKKADKGAEGAEVNADVEEFVEEF